MIDLIKLHEAIRRQLDVGTIEIAYTDHFGGRPCLFLRWRASALKKDVGFDEVTDGAALNATFVTEDYIAELFVANLRTFLNQGGDPPYLGRNRL